MTSRAAEVGRKVLAGLNRGRQIAMAQAQARSQERRQRILELAGLDIVRGHPAWGRAGRIARQLHGELSERQVKRILDSLSGVSESVAHTQARHVQEATNV